MAGWALGDEEGFISNPTESQLTGQGISDYYSFIVAPIA